MSKGAKIAIGIIAGIFFLGLATCGGFYLWFQANKDEMKQEGDRIKAEAAEFAASHTQTECVQSSLERLDACGAGELSGIMCKAMVNVFLGQCLEQATPVAELCEGVPDGNGIMEIATWSVAACDGAGRTGDEACARMMRELQKHCAKH